MTRLLGREGVDAAGTLVIESSASEHESKLLHIVRESRSAFGRGGVGYPEGLPGEGYNTADVLTNIRSAHGRQHSHRGLVL